MNRVMEWKEKFEADLYADNDQIIDTDYETYISFYGCSEYFDEVNQDGQKKQDVEKMIDDA